MKTQLSKPARTKARYTEEYKTVDDYICLKMDPETMTPGVRDVT